MKYGEQVKALSVYTHAQKLEESLLLGERLKKGPINLHVQRFEKNLRKFRAYKASSKSIWLTNVVRPFFEARK